MSDFNFEKAEKLEKFKMTDSFCNVDPVISDISLSNTIKSEEFESATIVSNISRDTKSLWESFYSKAYFTECQTYGILEEIELTDECGDLYKCKHPVGQISFLIDYKLKIVFIFNFEIFDKYQNNGYGSNTIKNLINENNDSSFHFCLFVSEENIKAANLYEKFGFKELILLKDKQDFVYKFYIK